MKRTFVMMALIALAWVAPVATQSQSKPDFSGTWTFNVRMTAREDRAQAPFTTLVIKQTATDLSVQTSAFQQRQPPIVYKLDGTESTTPTPSGLVSGHASWDGQKLLVTATRTFEGPQGPIDVRTKEVYSLAAGILTIERTQQTAGGELQHFKYIYLKEGAATPVPATAKTAFDDKQLGVSQATAALDLPREGAAVGCPQEPKGFRDCVMGKVKANASKLPRTPDGKPDLQGYWQINGALTATTPGAGIDEQPPSPLWNGGLSMLIDPPDGKIPFQPWAAKERARLQLPENVWMDPQAHCMNAGHPRQYFFMPFLVMRTTDHFVVLYEVSHSYRLIPMDGRPHVKANIGLWQGDSVGRWEGDTLVVDTSHNNGKAMVDMSFVFVSNALHTIERFTMIDPDLIYFETTIDDPKVYTRPWTVNGAFMRQGQQGGFQLLESACHEENQERRHFTTPSSH